MLTQTKQTATQSQKLMIFVLSMSLYGLATLFTELIPSVQVGVVEFSVEFFLFIPLTLAMLFDPPFLDRSISPYLAKNTELS